uniref:Flavonol synthase n=1 Tax=Crocus sativus TaxID=82528 RepID=A0A411MR97_CROSA|nr:flavonol synthase [Crocus sativus]
MFQVINHSIPKEAIEELQSAGKHFFELSREEKESYGNGKAKWARSFEGYGTNIHKDSEGMKKAWSDFLFHNVWPPSVISYDVWPRNPSSYRKANEDYARNLLPVVDGILSSLSVGLGLEKNALKDASGGDDLEMLMKINHYPPCPRPDLALGVPAHTDMSAITVLVPNDIPGLQLFKDGRWFDINYVPGALIIHIGDQIEILSNGRYKAVLHRARVNKDNVRFSWPVFCSPPPEMVVGPLPQLVSEENPPKFKAKKYKDYQYCKMNKLPQ